MLELIKLSNYKMLNDEDIVGEEDEDDSEEQVGKEKPAVDEAPDKWKRLEADLAKIREKTSKREEILTLR